MTLLVFDEKPLVYGELQEIIEFNVCDRYLYFR